MDRLAEILALIAAGGLTDEQLIDLDAELVALAEELSAEGVTDEVLAALDDIATATASIRTEAEGRRVAASEREDAAAERLAAIRGEQEPEEPAEEPAADEEPADAEPDAEPAEAEATPEPVSAATRAPRLSRVNARRPAAVAPKPLAVQTDPEHWGLTASANVGSFRPGERLDDPDKIGAAFKWAIESTRGYRGGAEVKVPIARSGAMDASEVYGEERSLDRNVSANMRKIDAITSARALTASGGICAPINTSYDLPVVGDTARPVRDALARFGADRGGVSTIPPPVLTDLDGAVGIWTEANDISLSSPSTKPCLTVTCPDEEETLVEAITLCLKFGNFRAKFWPEQIAAWVKLAAVNHARQAETELLTAIGTGSTQVSTGTLLGAAVDVLTTLDRAVPQIRSRHRISSSFPLRWIAPFWLKDMIRTDLAREMPGGTLDERFAAADATIEAWFRVRGVNVTWTYDGESGQVYGAQGDGPLLGWKSTAVTYLYPEGSWLFLDGGSLDLGIFRDSTLIGTNDVKMFSETFEAVHFHGVESYRLTMDLCPDGSRAGTVDIDPCSTGS